MNTPKDIAFSYIAIGASISRSVFVTASINSACSYFELSVSPISLPFPSCYRHYQQTVKLLRDEYHLKETVN